MPCETYREALIDAAAVGSVPSGELRGHLDACLSCRAFFDEERQLFAAIDSGVDGMANAEVPASLVSRVRIRLEQEPASRRSLWPRLGFAGVGVAFAIALFVAVRAQRPLLPGESAGNATVSPTPAQEIFTSSEKVATPLATAAAGRHSAHSTRGGRSLRPASMQLEVIVPPEEREALARYIKAQQGNNLSTTNVSIAPDAGFVSVALSPLEIDDLEVKPLEALESDTSDVRQDTQEN